MGGIQLVVHGAAGEGDSPWPLYPAVCLGMILDEWAATAALGFGLGRQARGSLPAQTAMRVFVAELNLTSGQGDTPPAAQFPWPGWEGASSGVSHPIPLSRGHVPCRIAVPGVSLGPVLVWCFPGQAWEG